MNKSFTYGAVAGISSIALAIPLLAQISSAASTGSSATTTTPGVTRPAPSQACVQALAAKDASFLSTIDAMIAAQKTATQTHEDALTAAAAITDDTQRAAAVKAADQAYRTAMQTAMQTQMTNGKTQMDALKTACGNAEGGMSGLGFGSGPMDGWNHGPMKGSMRGGMMNSTALATKLGITADQLKTELQSGKTIQDIAKEHGVTLPARLGFKGQHGQQTSSVQ